MCSYNFECPTDYFCVNNQCVCRKCQDDKDCHKYGMFCHGLSEFSLGECRKRCTPVKVWTEWCGCGVNEICEPIRPSTFDQTPFKGMDLGGICKSARFLLSHFYLKLYDYLILWLVPQLWFTMKYIISNRCNYHGDCNLIWKMEGSKCQDVEVGPFLENELDKTLNNGKMWNKIMNT